MYRAMLVALSLMFGAGEVGSQEGVGVLHGRVSDRSGEGLSGAIVRVNGPALTAEKVTTTDETGAYRVADLPPAAYEVRVSHIGYKTAVRANVAVAAGQEVELDFALQSQIIFLGQSVVSASRRQEKILDAPASVSVVEGDEIRNNPVLSVADHIKDLPAVDFAKTGLVQSNVVVRGFNNVFSGTLLTLTDNRIARVPSLRLNAYNFIPVTNDDVERIEVVLGPGSALYGPNSADGVMHIITHSPFTSQGTSVQLGAGERSLLKSSLRHAGVAGERLGYKISAQYYTGTDWEYNDPEEEAARKINPDIPERNFDVERRSAALRFDYRASDDLTAVLSAGYNQADQIELTGVGAGQADDWTYYYTQLRLLYRDWFFQAFRNWSDSGSDSGTDWDNRKTFLLRTGEPIVDQSYLTVFQAQHSTRLGKLRLTYGLDALLTRPVTGGTITGKNEDDDNVNEFGAYVQGEISLSPLLDLVLAPRYDYHNRLEDPQFSPRAALVFKPRETQTLRLTYNRAFSTPSTNNLHLDLLSARDPFGLGPNFAPLFEQLGLGQFKGIDIRAQGTYNSDSDKGLTFRRDAGGRPQFRSPFALLVAGQAAQLGLAPGAAGYPIGADGYMVLDHPVTTNVMWGIAREAVLGQFKPLFRTLAAGALAARGMGAEDAAAAAGQLAEALPDVVPAQLPGLRNRLGRLNLETVDFDFAAPNGGPIEAYDVPRTQSSITQTVELGYKGVVADNLVVAADLYQSKVQDFVAPLGIETPSVFLDPQILGAALGEGIGKALADPANGDLATVLAALDAMNVPGVLQGNNNGTPVDEMVGLLLGTAAAIPFGTVSPEQASDPYAVIASYRNFGEVTIRGLDLSLAYYPGADWKLSGNYSFVDDNFFENLQLSKSEGPGGSADIALNAPQHKAKLGAAYHFAQLGLELGGQLRYTGSFPMNSGAYVGEVDSYTVMDLNLTYQLPLEQDVVLQVDASNVLDQAYRSFVGAPEVGRLVFGQVGLRF